MKPLHNSLSTYVDYIEAPGYDLSRHLLLEYRFFIKDSKIKRDTNFNHDKLVTKLKVYRSPAGHMAYRSGIVYGEKITLEGIWREDDKFKEVFGVNGLYFKLFEKYNMDWNLVFGDESYGSYSKRVKVIETLYVKTLYYQELI